MMILRVMDDEGTRNCCMCKKALVGVKFTIKHKETNHLLCQECLVEVRDICDSMDEYLEQRDERL